MSAAPTFFATPVSPQSATVPSTADTSLTAPTNVADVVAGVTAGRMIYQIRIQQIATTGAAGVLNLFFYDGTNYSLVESYTYAPVTLSSTSGPEPVDFFYENLVLVGSTHKIKATVTASSGQSAFRVTAFCGDAT